VELFGEVRLDRVEANRWRRNADEVEEVFSGDELGGANHRVSEGDIDAEALTEELAADGALGAKAVPVIGHALILNLRVLCIGRDFEGHEVAQLAAPGFLESSQEIVWRPHHSQVDVLRRSCAVESELEHEAALQRGRFSEDPVDAGQEAVKDEELALATEAWARSQLAKPVLEGFAKRLG
jgi:hypothetical protein